MANGTVSLCRCLFHMALLGQGNSDETLLRKERTFWEAEVKS